MTVKDVAKVMKDQFVAVKVENEIAFSGKASKIENQWFSAKEVTEIKNARNEKTATIISCK